MKIKYSSDADVCIIELKPGIPIDSIDLKEGVILHLDQDGNPLEIEIIDASKFISLDEVVFSCRRLNFLKQINTHQVDREGALSD